jgi:hypothetical protein
VSGPTRVQSDANDGKMKTFKSKKELVFLAVAAVVFIGVILKMYVFKGNDMAGPAEEPVPQDVAAAPPLPTPMPSPATGGGTVALSDVEQLSISLRPKAPVKLPRNPFAMSAPMRDKIFKIKKAGPKETTKVSGEPITLTPENMKQTLSNIPGAEKALKYGLKLSGVMLSGSVRAAVINKRVVMKGRHILGFELVLVKPRSVVLKRGDHRVRLEIPKLRLPAEEPY